MRNSAEVDKYNMSSLRGVMSAAAPLSTELCQAVEKRFKNCRVTQGYGESSRLSSPYSKGLTVRPSFSRNVISRHSSRLTFPFLSPSPPCRACCAACLPTTLRPVLRPARLHLAPGLTEVSPLTHAMDLNLAVGRQGSIGKLVAHTEARLTETETGLDVSAGQPGELWVQSPSVMKGYLRNPEATKKTFSEDGWFKTGDVAVVTDDGYF